MNRMYGEPEDNRPAPYERAVSDEYKDDENFLFRVLRQNLGGTVHPYYIPPSVIEDTREGLGFRSRRVESAAEAAYPEDARTLRGMDPDEWRTTTVRAMARSGFPSTGTMLAMPYSDQQNTTVTPSNDYIGSSSLGWYIRNRPFFPRDIDAAQAARDRLGAPITPNMLVAKPQVLGHEMLHRIQNMRGLHADRQLVDEINSVLERRGGRLSEDGFSREAIAHLITPSPTSMVPSSIRAEFGSPSALSREDRMRIVQALENYFRRRANSVDYERADRTLPGGQGGRGRPTYE